MQYSKVSRVPDPNQPWVDLASLVSSGNFHLGSRVCGRKQLSSVSQASSALEHRSWSLEIGGLRS